MIGVREKNCISCGFGGENKIICVSTFETSEKRILGNDADESIDACSLNRVRKGRVVGYILSQESIPRTSIGRES